MDPFQKLYNFGMLMRSKTYFFKNLRFINDSSKIKIDSIRTI